MYAEFFGLKELPFNNTPDPRFFYSTPDHEEALASLIYAVKERKGFVLLTGEVGAGKTLVSRLMIKHFAGSVSFGIINHAIRGSADLMESLCAEFELPHEKNASNTHLVRLLHDYLLTKFAHNVGVVLVLDEAQNLSVEAFEQLRMIGNLEADDAKLLQIAIVGQPELKTLFQSSALRQLRQRLFRTFHLPALDRKAVEGYIRHRLTVAGAADPGIFAPRAIDAIHRASRGLPRLINTLCDNVLLSAYSADHKTIDGEFVESVLAGIDVFDSTGPKFMSNPSSPGIRKANFEGADSDRVLHQQQGLTAACRQAAALVGQLETGTRRAAQANQMLDLREQKLAGLLHMVKSSAAHLAPLLDELNTAVRRGLGCNETSLALLRRLTEQTARSQSLMNQVATSIHQTRLAYIQTRALSPGSSSPSFAPRQTIGPVPQPTSKTLIHSEPMLSQAHALRSDVLPADSEPIFADQSRPALRLARQMENLADLVHQAVSVCAPGVS